MNIPVLVDGDAVLELGILTSDLCSEIRCAEAADDIPVPFLP